MEKNNKNDRINEYEINGSKIKKINSCLYEVCKSICKIFINNNKICSGFLIKLYKGDNEFYCIMTNEHLITKQMILSNEIIEIYYDNQKKRIKIELNKNERFIRDYKYINIDVTIIEILNKDNINEDYFLLPNLDYNYNELINKEI